MPVNKSIIEIDICGYSPSPNPDGAGYNDTETRTSTIIRKVLAEGIADDQVDRVWANDTDDASVADLAASATRTFNLAVEPDARGNNVGLGDIAMLYIEHKPDSLSSSIALEASAANPWLRLLSTSSNLTLRPGDFILVGATTLGNLALTGSNKQFDLVNNDGVNAASYRIEVWGREY